MYLLAQDIGDQSSLIGPCPADRHRFGVGHRTLLPDEHLPPDTVKPLYTVASRVRRARLPAGGIAPVGRVPDQPILLIRRVLRHS
ncbi:hypothetical protein GCM10023077_03280 [Mycolicibacterium helvum]